jgi:hypothetical protein
MRGRKWQRAWLAGLSVLLGVAVAVLVNLWTGGWAWPTGVGLGILALVWAGVEVVRSMNDDSKNDVRIHQQATSLKGSKVVGYEGVVPDTQMLDVKQTMGVVQDSTIIGVTDFPASGGATLGGGEVDRRRQNDRG